MGSDLLERVFIVILGLTPLAIIGVAMFAP
jgi:hypothetical protein